MIFYFYFLFLARRACGAGFNLSGRLAARFSLRPAAGPHPASRGAAPHGLGADAPQEDHYSGLAAPPSEMCRRKIGDDAAVAPQALRAENKK